MKRLLVVLLSLGLIAAFSMTASAADVKFGGSYYVVGVYENHPQVYDSTSGYDYSHAFFYQRVRLQPVFQIAEGLTFTARMDALEKQWGNTNWKGGTDDLTSSRKGAVATQKIQENIEFERAYVTFLTGIGQFQVGYQNVDDWGTDFGDYSNSRPRIMFSTKAGNLILIATYEKVFETDTAAPVMLAGTQIGSTADGTKVYSSTVTKSITNFADADNDTYALSGIYKDKGVEAGLLYKYYVYDSNKWLGARTLMTQLSPYTKLTAGPLYFEGEATYWFGKAAQYEAPASALAKDVDLKAWSLYLKGRMDAGPAYIGAVFSLASGNDLSDDTKNTTAPSGGGTNFAPAMILLNDGFNTWTGGHAAASPGLSSANPVTSAKYNTVIYNAFAGFNPTKQLNVEAALTYATVDKKALYKSGGIVYDADSNKLGTEFDVKATYKIYDNLTYMLGAGYLWTGDYFKGYTAPGATAKSISNDYVLMNQLTLSF